MLSNIDIRNLAYYFSKFDHRLTSELAVSEPPDERELTRRLSRMLAGDETWSIDFTPSQDWLEERLGWSLQLTMQAHPSKWEHHVSHSDFGLIISFKDEVRQMPTQSAAYLIQAKRLYTDTHGQYSLASKFGAVDRQQRLKLRHLAKRLGEAAVKFAAYCPPVDFFESTAAEVIRTTHQSNASALYVGSTFGLALQQHLELEPSPVSEAGFWITPTLEQFRTAADLHKNAIIRNLPFGWFVIANAWNLSILGSEVPSKGRPLTTAPFVIPWMPTNPAFGNLFNIGIDAEIHRLTMGLARGDSSVAQELAAGTDAEVPASAFRPSATFEVTVMRRAHPTLKPTLDDIPQDDADPGFTIGRF